MIVHVDTVPNSRASEQLRSETAKNPPPYASHWELGVSHRPQIVLVVVLRRSDMATIIGRWHSVN